MAQEIPSPVQSTVLVTLAAAALANASPETAASIVYEVESELEVSVSAFAMLGAAPALDFDFSDSLEWQDLVWEATYDHRSMEPWERKATDTFFDSLFD